MPLTVYSTGGLLRLDYHTIKAVFSVLSRYEEFYL
nr:MAG TPA: hypothetical protein [Caudoviricetes sp.]